MKIIEVNALDNGAHRNQETNMTLPIIPDGWAVIPDSMEVPNTFPFVNVEAELIPINSPKNPYYIEPEIDQAGNIIDMGEVSPISENAGDAIYIVTSLAEGVVPEPEPIPEPEPTAEEDLMQMAVDHELRITMLELGVE